MFGHCLVVSSINQYDFDNKSCSELQYPEQKENAKKGEYNEQQMKERMTEKEKKLTKLN